MKVDIGYRFNQIVYLKNDREQAENYIKRIILEPKGRIVLELFSPTGDIFEAYEEFVSSVKSIITPLGDSDDEEE